MYYKNNFNMFFICNIHAFSEKLSKTISFLEKKQDLFRKIINELTIK